MAPSPIRSVVVEDVRVRDDARLGEEHVVRRAHEPQLGERLDRLPLGAWARRPPGGAELDVEAADPGGAVAGTAAEAEPMR